MATDDEARARTTLVEMQGRLTQGPHATLGLDDQASPEQVRAAFLALTKQYHPARFGRLSTEIQRLSNEVFLGIKSAHESMLRALGASSRPGGVRRPTGTPPVVTAEGSSKMHSAALRAGAQQPSRGASPPTPSRTVTPPTTTPARTSSNARPGTPPPQPPLPSNEPPPPTVRGVVMPQGTPSFKEQLELKQARDYRVASATAPTATAPLGVRTTPRLGSPPTSPPKPSTPARAPQLPPLPSNEPPAATVRGIGVMPQNGAPAFNEQLELKQARDCMAANNWAKARAILNGLAVRIPTKQYRALICYTRGREAQALAATDPSKGAEAIMELDRAIQLDPDLAEAKSALAILYRRR